MTLSHAMKIITATGGTLFADDPIAAKQRNIRYGGKGWYSLDDCNTYRKGKRPTYSHILIK